MPSARHILARAGGVLFRWRSYSFVLLVPLLVLAARFRRFDEPAMERAFEYLCLAAALAGEAVRLLTVGFIANATSGRGTVEMQSAAINVTGMYSVVRHPLYLGSLGTLLGLTLLFQNPLLLGGCFLIWIAFYGPIMLLEEQYLLERFPAPYRAYRSRVPMLLPQPWKFRRPLLPWSWRMAIRREHDTLMGIVLFWAAFAQYRDYMLRGFFQPDLGRGLLLGTVLLGWAVAKTLKRTERVLVER